MALVILSAGKLSRSGIRTLSFRALVAIVSASLIVVAAGAFALGVGVGRSGVEVPAERPLTLDHPEGRVLIDRLGELSGRLVRLENEAVTLARRVGIVKEFESQQKASRSSASPNAPTGVRPATPPSGGPMIPALGEGVAVDVQALAFDDHGVGLSQLEREISRLDSVLFEIGEVTDERNLQLMTFPSRPPVQGVERNSTFGNRLDPFNRRAAFHSGLDFPAPVGTPILASAGGRVVHSGYLSDYGYTVEIDHGNGLITRYAHCSRLYVKVGEVVTPQQRIAAVGSTGRSTGPHLHFEVIKDGLYSDPELYLVRS